MIPSLRLAIYFGFGAVLWVMSAAIPGFIVVAGLYNLILILVAGLDLALSPQPRDFDLQRQVEPKMNLGVPNPVTLQARSRAARPIKITLRDEPPPAWPVRADDAPLPDIVPSLSALDSGEAGPEYSGVPPVARLTYELGAQDVASGTYTVTPTRRGDFAFGALSARYATALGFWHRQFRRATPATVQVYPDTTEVRRYELRLRQGRLRDIGLHLLRLRGQGTQFESLREYSRDDEYKSINWKASARQGKLISTNYEIERDQTILIAVDCGRMMTAMASVRDERAPSGQEGMRDENQHNLIPHPSSPVPLSKLDCAINATVLLSHVAASMGDAVGLLLFSDTVLGFVPPRKGRTQTGAIIEALYAAQPSLVEPDYIGAYEYLMARKLRRALVVTFTDLIDPEASRELLTASGALRRHHNALCVTVNNRDVIDLAEMMPQRAEELYQKAMAQRMLRQRAGALEELRQHGVGILDVEASQLTIATVNRYLDLKSRAAL